MTGGNSVERTTVYEVRVSLSDSSLPAGTSPTIQNYDNDANNSDLHDGDGDNGVLNSGFSTISLTTAGLGANDHTFDFGFGVPSDFGDLPDTGAGTGSGNYNTNSFDNGPSHLIVSGLYLGTSVDDDSNGQPTSISDGDDNDGNDDDDGVTFVTPLNAGDPATINVVASQAGFLNAWVDYNGDGDFDDAGEQIATDLAVAAGSNNLNITVPLTATAILHSRFRFTSNDPSGALGPTGSWPNGEVEDYVLSGFGDYGWADLDGDGIQDLSEPPVPNIVANLLDDMGNPVLDGAGNPISTFNRCRRLLYVHRPAAGFLSGPVRRSRQRHVHHCQRRFRFQRRQ